MKHAFSIHTIGTPIHLFDIITIFVLVVHHFSQETGCRNAFIHWKIFLVANCMLSFQELCEWNGIEPSSLFLYLWLRSAMKACGVPMHPNVAWFDLSSSNFFPSRKAFEVTEKRSAIQRSRKRPSTGGGRGRVRKNFFTSSKNHQLIHYNFLSQNLLDPTQKTWYRLLR